MASTTGGTSGSDRLDDLFTQLEQTARQIWDGLTGDSINLHELPERISQHVHELMDKVSNNGTLPLPQWKDMPTAWAPEPTPPPPPPVPSLAQQLVGKAHRHPFISAAVLGGTIGGTAYYLAPQATIRFLTPFAAPLKPYVPLALLPKSNRPLRVISEQGEIRKEAVLVLGAEGVAAELALDLENRGFIVIATVSDPSDVDVLEKRSRGWMKVLVLDPSEASSVAPFLRSLSTSLSLRFPLHTSGDPFSRPSHTLALSAVVNCLSITPSAEALCPVEGFEGDDIRRAVGERVATVVGVIKGVLPIMRLAAGRPGAPEGVFVSLFPATTTNVALPFLSLASSADAAIISLLHSLRRELTATRTSPIRISILETGFFDLPSSISSAQSTSTRRAEMDEGLTIPLRLNSLYAPALARRRVFGATSTIKAEGTRRKGSQPRKLNRKVFNIIVYGRGGVRSSVGAGAFTYRLVSLLLPTSLLDTLLSMQDRLSSLYLQHHQRLAASQTIAAPPSTAATPRARPPLPTPPTAHPSALRPGHSAAQASQIRVDDFSSSGYASSEEGEGDKSSIEDFGSLGESGLGSFVSVGRDENQA